MITTVFLLKALVILMCILVYAFLVAYIVCAIRAWRRGEPL